MCISCDRERNCRICRGLWQKPQRVILRMASFKLHKSLPGKKVRRNDIEKI